VSDAAGTTGDVLEIHWSMSRLTGSAAAGEVERGYEFVVGPLQRAAGELALIIAGGASVIR
jgi:hypothetical protein